MTACQPKLSNVNTSFTVPLRNGELPIEYFAKLPLFEKMKLSPDGMTISYIQNDSGKVALITKDLVGDKTKVILLTDNKGTFITDYSWINNERLLVKIKGYEQVQDLKFYVSRLVAINKDGTQKNDNLIPFSKSDNYSQIQDNFTKIPNDNTHVFIELDKNHRGFPDVYKLDVYTGDLTKIESNKGWISDWIYDVQGNVRIGIGFNRTMYTVIHRFNKDDEWKTLSENDSFKVLGFDENPDILFITDIVNGKAALFRFNLRTNSKELVFADNKYDVRGFLVRSIDGKRVIGMNYLQTGGKIEYLDSESKELQKKADKLLPETGNIIVSSASKNHLIYSSNSDVSPKYYLYDESKNTIHDIADTYPELKRGALSSTNKVAIHARDGLEMEAYLTQPTANKQKPSPTIIFPHGGPWSRDHNTFNPWTQYLANRGFTVIQVNFRGSEGFGEDFMRRGFKQWGLKMQEDIADVTTWAISNNYAEKKQICIVGASYGGYASLMGIIKSPDLYRCAIALAPVTNLTRLVDNLNDRRWKDSDVRSKIADTRIGDWWYDSDILKVTSPVNLVNKITKPLLVAHGAEDRNVPVSDSRTLISELKDINYNNYQYLEFEHSDHYLLVEEDRINFFKAMDAFLKSNLIPDY